MLPVGGLACAWPATRVLIQTAFIINAIISSRGKTYPTRFDGVRVLDFTIDGLWRRQFIAIVPCMVTICPASKYGYMSIVTRLFIVQDITRL